MPYNIRWCANCEELVAVEDGIEGHTILVGEFPFDVDFCDGPFYSCEPPMVDPDFDMQEEPSGDELFIMNKNAEELLYDLGMS